MNRRVFGIVLLLLLLVAVIGVGYFALLPGAWIIVGLVMTVFVGAVGLLTKGRWAGVLIDERNRMSLSRLQMVVWTLILVSAFVTLALQRIKVGATDAVAIGLPSLLWALMGISTTSLVGSPLLKSPKQNREPTAQARIRAESRVSMASRRWKRETTAALDDQREGILYANPNYEDASFLDIFCGDELNNFDRIDLAKVQMFYFTLIGVVSYAVLLFGMMALAGGDNNQIKMMNSFPNLSEGLVALLAISHAGYLTNAAITHTPSEPT